jgi:hypothetical protein
VPTGSAPKPQIRDRFRASSPERTPTERGTEVKITDLFHRLNPLDPFRRPVVHQPDAEVRLMIAIRNAAAKMIELQQAIPGHAGVPLVVAIQDQASKALDSGAGSWCYIKGHDGFAWVAIQLEGNPLGEVPLASLDGAKEIWTPRQLRALGRGFPDPFDRDATFVHIVLPAVAW